jgi:hypothetical protein
MGAVTVIVIRRLFSVDKIPKSHDSVFRQGKIRNGRDSRIQNGNGDSLPRIYLLRRRVFGGKKICIKRHDKHLPSFFIKVCQKEIFGKGSAVFLSESIFFLSGAYLFLERKRGESL